MSNYAPDPRTEKVYDNLQNKTLADVTAEDIQKLTDPTFIQATNQDALLTYNTINQAAMRDGGFIPGTSQIVKLDMTDNVDYTLFTPSKGEVWALMGADASSFGTGQNAATLKLSDGTTDMVIADSSSAGDMNDHSFRTGVYVGENVSIVFQPNNISSGTATIKIYLMRVR
tara:strand:- start:151 stop:663 length:513 start_codon:yes stop_codon:yes gene_type:complete